MQTYTVLWQSLGCDEYALLTNATNEVSIHSKTVLELLPLLLTPILLVDDIIIVLGLLIYQPWPPPKPVSSSDVLIKILINVTRPESP